MIENINRGERDINESTKEFDSIDVARMLPVKTTKNELAGLILQALSTRDKCSVFKESRWRSTTELLFVTQFSRDILQIFAQLSNVLKHGLLTFLSANLLHYSFSNQSENDRSFFSNLLSL